METIYIISTPDKPVKIVYENDMTIEETENEFEFLIKLVEKVEVY